MISTHLRKFFEVEIRNEERGGIRPATLNSALDSLEQAPDDVAYDWSGGGTRDALIQEIAGLIRSFGGDQRLAYVLYPISPADTIDTEAADEINEEVMGLLAPNLREMVEDRLDLGLQELLLRLVRYTINFDDRERLDFIENPDKEHILVTSLAVLKLLQPETFREEIQSLEEELA